MFWSCSYKHVSATDSAVVEWGMQAKEVCKSARQVFSARGHRKGHLRYTAPEAAAQQAVATAET